MKITLISILALVTVALGARMPQKAVIISYPDDTPDSVIQQAMDAIRDAGGMITHEYKLIKGFAGSCFPSLPFDPKPLFDDPVLS